MTVATHIPDDPEAGEWDVCVVGTGMGGATAGYVLARLGRRVLFLEKGRYHQRDEGTDYGHDRAQALVRDPEVRLRKGWWPLQIQGRTSFGEATFYAPLGCGSGGSTSLYASALERFAPEDFRPKSNHPLDVGSTLPEAWPISYEELLPYYRQAEELFRIRGTKDPLSSDASSALLEPPSLSERDQDLFEMFRECGLHPYRVHVGCEFLDGCDQCGGKLCERECKGDAGRVALVPAVEEHGAKILSQCEVLSLEADECAVKRIRCRWNGRELNISSKIVVLAAGAFMTPIILLNSKSESWPDGLANRSGLVGRNLMLHTSDFVAVRSQRGRSRVGPSKALALNDFYVSDGVKMGTFQSIGIEPGWRVILGHLRSVADMDPRWWRRLTKPFLVPTAFVAGRIFRGSHVFATIVEDLPYHENRVLPDPRAKNGMRFEYEYTDELLERNRLYRQRLTQVLGWHRIAFLSVRNNINYGHVCGTCRFGTDSAASVLDRNNRAHDVENLYVVDASFFPSSGGTNPSLTISANAIRVAEEIDARLV